jgi:hypothetical protein
MVGLCPVLVAVSGSGGWWGGRWLAHPRVALCDAGGGGPGWTAARWGVWGPNVDHRLITGAAWWLVRATEPR